MARWRRWPRWRRASVVLATVVLGVLGSALDAALPSPAASAATASNTLPWTQQSPSSSPSARTRSAAAYDPATHQTVLFGGASGAAANQETWTWSAGAWTQQAPSASPGARAGAALAWDPATSQLLLFGGGTSSGVASDTWVWTGSTWTQLSPATVPPARTNAQLAYSPAGHQLVLFGGQDGGGAKLGDTWTWSGAGWTQYTGAAPPARSGGGFVGNPATGRAVLFGGSGSGGLLADTWVWTGSAWSQRSPAASPSARSGAAFVFDPRIGRPTLIGGSTGAADSAEIWTWDGGSWTQTTTSGTPTARDGAAAAYSSTGTDIVLFGGTDGTGAALGDTWTSDLAPNTGPGFVQVASTGPPARSGASMAFDDATGQLVLFGGTAADGTLLRDTWTWNGTAWNQLAPAASPPARAYAAMAYDPATAQLVLFGGSEAAGDANDTWIWDGATWTQATTATLPAGREQAVLGYAYGTAPDGSGQLVLFGGLGGATSYNDTFLWTGSDWARPTAGQSGTTPTKRYGSTIGWDPASSQLLMVSGYGTNATWAWGSTGWQQLSPTGNAPTRTQATVAFDDATGQMLIYGGVSGGVTKSDLYSWDGANWSTMPSAVVPSPAVGSAPMVFDPATGQMLMFGGNSGSASSATQATWVWDSLPLALAATPLGFSTTLNGYDQSFSSLQSVQINTPSGSGWTITMSASRVPQTGGVLLTSPAGSAQPATFTVNGSSTSATSSAAPAGACLDAGCAVPLPSGSVAYPLALQVLTPVTVYSASAGSGIGRSTVAFRVWSNIRADSKRATYTSGITITTNYGP